MIKREQDMLQDPAAAAAAEAPPAHGAGASTAPPNGNADGGSASGGAGGASSAQGAEIEPGTCPICLDTFGRRTMTSCGHAYCS
ncbi:hypothetical protein MNEG_16190, partial [Monoraphidium neglectum]